MNLDDATLRAILREGEGKTSEFKRGLQRDATLARTLSAFANTRGGMLFVGVGDRGEIVGAPRPEQTMQHLERIARTCVDPPLAVEIAIVVADAKRVVVCSVPFSPERPHAAIDADGSRRVLVRAGSSNRTAGAQAQDSMSRRATFAADTLEARVLAWIDAGDASEVTVAAFARSTGTGMQSARRAFANLEAAGSLIGHGSGAARAFGRPR